MKGWLIIMTKKEQYESHKKTFLEIRSGGQQGSTPCGGFSCKG
jgi:hypothetical protein